MYQLVMQMKYELFNLCDGCDGELRTVPDVWDVRGVGNSTSA